MTLYFCTACNTVYDLNGNAPICPRCGELLGLRREEPDKAATLSELAAEAMSGPAPRFQPAWRVG